MKSPQIEVFMLQRSRKPQPRASRPVSVLLFDLHHSDHHLAEAVISISLTTEPIWLTKTLALWGTEQGLYSPKAHVEIIYLHEADKL